MTIIRLKEKLDIIRYIYLDEESDEIVYHTKSKRKLKRHNREKIRLNNLKHKDKDRFENKYRHGCWDIHCSRCYPKRETEGLTLQELRINAKEKEELNESIN